MEIVILFHYNQRYVNLVFYMYIVLYSFNTDCVIDTYVFMYIKLLFFNVNVFLVHMIGHVMQPVQSGLHGPVIKF